MNKMYVCMKKKGGKVCLHSRNHMIAKNVTFFDKEMGSSPSHLYL